MREHEAQERAKERENEEWQRHFQLCKLELQQLQAPPDLLLLVWMVRHLSRWKMLSASSLQKSEMV